MYSDERNVQITLSLLKAYHISHVVLSPGGSDAPIVKSFENDSFFHCYSVVDERSSVFFAIGLSQELNEPVVCVCTSGTAVSNYLTGITEAYYQNIPIVAITSDSHACNFDQLVLQKLNQDEIFKGVIRFETTLPPVNNKQDEWHCNRIVNEALLALDHHGTGPVHINIPITQTLSCNATSLPKERKINRKDTAKTDFSYYSNYLVGKKVLVVVGENSKLKQEDNELLNKFFDRYNCVYNIETISNVNCKGCVITYPSTETGSIYNNPDIVPDIVISLGNFVASYMLKPFLVGHYKAIENWLVNESGVVRDPYWSLKEIFEGSAREFFEGILSVYNEEKDNHSYYDAWKKTIENVKHSDIGFSSMSIAKLLSETMTDNSVLHTAILNSTRLMQFFPPQNKVTCYTNLGALGIDGCTATAVGHSMASDKLTYLLTGDLSFFYGMNAVSIRDLKNNLRVILLNNGGGEEFKIKLNLPELDKYVCARSNHRSAKGWVESLNFDYFTATNNEEVKKVLDTFSKPSDKPLFLEVFLDMEKDAEIIRKIYALNRPEPSLMGKVKGLIASILPETVIEQIKNVLG